MPIQLDDLRESNAFLNVLFEKIPALILLADHELRIHEINDAYQALFGLSRENALNLRCGNALQCAFAVTENALCGETSNCEQCRIRHSALDTLLKKVPTDGEKLTHTFFIQGRREKRHFEFSTRYIQFHGQEMVMILLHDVTVLEQQKLDLITKQQKIDESLRAAGQIQQSLLPSELPCPERLKFAWKCQPCEDIGGDILNVVRLDATHIGFYMLDVAGHGTPSAMISVLVYQLMDPHAGILVDHGIQPPMIRNPEQVMDMLNTHFPYMRFERHFTMVYGILDVASGIMTYSNAAHCHPVLVPAHGNIRDLDISGTIIGLEGIPFGQESLRLESGDKVVLVSDGLLEATDATNTMYGEERYMRYLQTHRHLCPESLVESLYTSASNFAQNKSMADDLSILAFEYT
jgi:phosphoserine phosphatase RsbU/P